MSIAHSNTCHTWRTCHTATQHEETTQRRWETNTEHAARKGARKKHIEESERERNGQVQTDCSTGGEGSPAARGPTGEVVRLPLHWPANPGGILISAVVTGAESDTAALFSNNHTTALMFAVTLIRSDSSVISVSTETSKRAKAGGIFDKFWKVASRPELPFHRRICAMFCYTFGLQSPVSLMARTRPCRWTCRRSSNHH